MLNDRGKKDTERGKNGLIGSHRSYRKPLQPILICKVHLPLEGTMRSLGLFLKLAFPKVSPWKPPIGFQTFLWHLVL